MSITPQPIPPMNDTIYKLLEEIEKVKALADSSWSDTVQIVNLKEMFALCEKMREDMAR